ncbi:MAG: hydrogenase formation protein HypD, partial [Deltaproteobacteria bacterium]|nr:hydrogenase formation protein HypD [Deltaproteobacteria bacterium]
MFRIYIPVKIHSELPQPYRDKILVERLASSIRSIPLLSPIKIMHVCGTHENAISRFGIRDLLPDGVTVIAGPGCPVCVCPTQDIELAMDLALEKGVILATFGDMVRAPSTKGTLLDTRAKGGDVRIVYSPFDVLKIAEENPDKEAVLFSVGFETTACGVASLVQSMPPKNLSFLISHRLIPPAMEFLLGVGDLYIDGFLIPGQVTTVRGLEEYRLFPVAYRMPVVSAGFEPVDVLMGILMILRQIKDKKPGCENAYKRAVKETGNPKAKEAIKQVFDIVFSYWRGIGRIPRSGLILKERYKDKDARYRFGLSEGESIIDLNPGCSCHLIMIGKINPAECPLFKTTCTPQTPYGPCMVSFEGTCNSWYRFTSPLLRLRCLPEVLFQPSL